MFKKNKRHLQIPLTSHVDELPEKLRKRLKYSWAGTFYQEVFCNLDETPFAVLYADIPSRPNVPVNVLVGLEYFKAENDWTDEEMYDYFSYDVQVRYALGYRQLGEGDYSLRAQYYFRERLSRYMQEEGINLLEKAFEQVTDEQIKKHRVKTGKQRTDSTQVASNIRMTGRVQLLVEVLQRVHRILSEAEKEHYAEDYAPYLKGHAGQFVHRMKKKEIGSHLGQIGSLMQRLLVELKQVHGEEPVYQVLERVFGEHFEVEKSEVMAKSNEELNATSLQSPDDLEATYRKKRGKSYRGYVTSVTETCDPKNKLQLITKVQTAPNNTDDSQLLAEALPNLKERTDLNTLFTDGSYASPETDELLQKLGVKQIQTAIRGRNPDPHKLHLSDFEIRMNEEGKPVEIICPHGQMVSVQNSKRNKAFVAHFSAEVCASCPLAGKCPAKQGKRDQRYHLRITKKQALVAIRRKCSLEFLEEGRNLRASVEATMRSVKNPFPAGKLPVRGRFRVSCMMIGSAAMANVRRIQRYVESKKEQEKEGKNPQDLSVYSFFYVKKVIRSFFNRSMKPLFFCRFVRC